MKVFFDLAGMSTCCWGLPKTKYEPFITHNRGTLRPVHIKDDKYKDNDIALKLFSILKNSRVHTTALMIKGTK